MTYQLRRTARDLEGRGSGDPEEDASLGRRLEYRIRRTLGGSQGHH